MTGQISYPLAGDGQWSVFKPGHSSVSFNCNILIYTGKTQMVLGKHHICVLTCVQMYF